jgi:hypothetical protein
VRTPLIRKHWIVIRITRILISLVAAYSISDAATGDEFSDEFDIAEPVITKPLPVSSEVQKKSLWHNSSFSGTTFFIGGSKKSYGFILGVRGNHQIEPTLTTAFHLIPGIIRGGDDDQTLEIQKLELVYAEDWFEISFGRKLIKNGHLDSLSVLEIHEPRSYQSYPYRVIRKGLVSTQMTYNYKIFSSSLLLIHENRDHSKATDSDSSKTECASGFNDKIDQGILAIEYENLSSGGIYLAKRCSPFNRDAHTSNKELGAKWRIPIGALSIKAEYLNYGLTRDGNALGLGIEYVNLSGNTFNLEWVKLNKTTQKEGRNLLHANGAYIINSGNIIFKPKVQYDLADNALLIETQTLALTGKGAIVGFSAVLRSDDFVDLNGFDFDATEMYVLSLEYIL